MILKTPSKVFAQFTLDKLPIHKEMSKRTVESNKHVSNQKVLYEPVYTSQRIKHKYSKSFLYDTSLIKQKININNYKQRCSSTDNVYEDELMLNVVSKFEKIYHNKEQAKPIGFHTKVKEFTLSKSNSCVGNGNNNNNNHLHSKCNSNSNIFRKQKKNYHQYIKLKCFEFNELPLNDKLYNIIQKFKETNVKSIMLDKEIKNKFCRPSYFNTRITTNSNYNTIDNNNHKHSHKPHLKSKSSFSYSCTQRRLPMLHHKHSHLSTISTRHSRKSSSSSQNKITFKYIFT